MTTHRTLRKSIAVLALAAAALSGAACSFGEGESVQADGEKPTLDARASLRWENLRVP